MRKYMARATVVMLGVGAVLVLAAAWRSWPTGDGSQTVVGDGDDFAATWSPDGRRIAFMREYSMERNEIWVVGGDGTREHRITRDATNETEYVVDSRPLWSPDGTRIAYSFRSGGIRVIATDGTGDRALTTKTGDSPTSWSRDGRRILFVRSGAPYTVDVGTLRVTRAPGSRPIWGPSPPPIGDARWSGDARWIVATASIEEEVLGQEDYRDELLIMPTARGPWRTLDVEYCCDRSGSRGGFAFAWAPRAARLAFATGHGLFVTTPSGKPHRVPGALGVRTVAWSPNGAQLLWTSGGNSFYVADADGRRRRAIVTLETLAQLRGDRRVIRPGALASSPPSPSWAPGAEVAFDLSFPCNRSGIHVVNPRTGMISRLTNRC